MRSKCRCSLCLQFALLLGAGPVLHRPTSLVIHRLEWNRLDSFSKICHSLDRTKAISICIRSSLSLSFGRTPERLLTRILTVEAATFRSNSLDGH
jgi:hypothetical protein